MLFKADPTFYPSPKLAMQAPQENLAYVAALNANGGSKPDALVVVDVDPHSKSYAEIIGRVDMPNVGDELHHFGWNACSSALCPYAAHRLLKSRHPRGGGMRVGWWSLGWWSFLMASSHGAGLMVIPILMAEPGHAHSHTVATPSGIDAYSGSLIAWAVLVHTAGLLLAAGGLAVLVYATYEKSGLRMLQHAWFNFDLLWALALLVAGVAALAL